MSKHERSDRLIVKKCSVPIKITAIEALLPRLAPNHPKRPALESELSSRMAGYWGEQATSSILEALPEKEFFIFHDIRLESNPYPVQMDLLILSSTFILILEVKNIAGELNFDDSFNQLVRTYNNQTDGFDNPVQQVNLQRKKLQAWLSAKKIPAIPIEVLVVSANPKAVLRAENKRFSEIVIRKSNLTSKIEHLTHMHSQEILPKKELKKLKDSLLKAHTPYVPNILEVYHISPNELALGVLCPNCSALPMTRKWGKWVCSHCSSSLRDAHLLTLRDYALLIKPVITNRELRRFLQIKSASIAAKILDHLNLPSSGSTKDRVYHLNWQDFDKNSYD